MLRKLLILITFAAFYASTGCVRETYDMDTLSMRAHFSPTFGISAFRGDISLSDLIEPNDTVFFDENDLLKIFFREDSVINFKLDDYENFNTIGEFSFNEGYQLSPLPLYSVNDTITYEPGNDIKIEKIVILTGSIDYKVTSKSLTASTFTVTFPSIFRDGIQISESVDLPANQTVSGSISLDDTYLDFSTDPDKKYNRLPISCSIEAETGSFSLTDSIYFDLNMERPDFDYIKGYFGKQTETIEEDSIDLDIKEILDHISGDFLISNPSLTVNYKNSFGVPVKIKLEATGYKMEETIDLDYDPVILSYPVFPGQREIEASLQINKNNSKLPQLVSMPPEKIKFSGSAVMNPDDPATMDNYIFGESSFLGDLEIEVPMEFRMTELTFTDTTDNFLQMDDPGESPVNPEDFEFLQIKIEAENGFPLGVSLSLVLYDSVSHENLCVIDASDILQPAPVNTEGRVTAPASCVTEINITRDFWESINVADKIIFKFTLNTTDSGTKDVKIYSDYKIDFKAALVLKPDIKFDL